MVPHHESAIEMAKLAAERGEHAEIKRFAADIIAAQQSEIAQMEAWRNAWDGNDSAGRNEGNSAMSGEHSMMSGGMSMEKQVESLRKADPFDKAFLAAMVPHHESAIEMAKPAVERAQHDELRELARKIVDAQARDIDRMNGWLRAWF